MRKIKSVLKLILLLLIIYALLRLGFLIVYYIHENWSFTQLLKTFYWGLRLDFTALFYINLPFLLFYFFINPLLKTKSSNRLAIFIFCIINLPFIALNFIDLIYYHFNSRRSTIDLFSVIGGSGNALNSFFKLYWPYLLIFLLASSILVLCVKKILRIHEEKSQFKKQTLITTFFFLIVLAVAARGLAKRPILPSTPLLYFPSHWQPLINNSTFNFIYSIVRIQTTLEKKNYFTEKELGRLYTIRRQYLHDTVFTKRNVVIFILESFSKHYFKKGLLKAKTPFFDSLMQYSIVCNNAFANGLESNKGITAILASLPQTMDEPFYQSNYNSVKFKGIGTLLKEEGYNTSFFMGAEHDHFGFAKLCKMIGIDDYHSKDTYGNSSGKDDGNWGLFDEYFFQYFVEEISRKKQPFFTTLFNISSHPPYTLPKHRQKEFNIPGQNKEQNSISYVDDCFKELFREMQTKSWFNNTIFVFSADHAIGYENWKKSTLYKRFQIPLFIFDPQNPQPQSINKIVQQLDIAPTILDVLHYSKPFMSFGNSIFQQKENFAFNKIFDTYQWIDSTTLTGYDEKNETLVYHYNYLVDSSLSNNLLSFNNRKAVDYELKIKLILQRFQNSLIEQKLLIK